MPRPSALIAKLEDWAADKLGDRVTRILKKIKKYIPFIIVGWYFYGMLINSIRLGIDSVFGDEAVNEIWVADPFRNLIAIFTPTGLGVIAISVLLFCLITKKGYIWFSGYKFTRDSRGFDILPDATHGSSGFMAQKEMKEIICLSKIEDTSETVIGKYMKRPDDENALYATVKDDSEYRNHAHSIIFGATGSGKSQGFVIPFLLQAVRRGESVIVVDPKGELYEKTSEYLRSDAGYTTKIFNLLDLEASDAWNPFEAIESDPGLVDTIAEIIIKNTSNISERQDFWEKAEKNLLTALMHYVQTQTIPGTNELMPIEHRSLAAIYRMLSNESFGDLERRMDALPKGHPAKAPYGIFKLANRQIWGNIAIGLGNRLSVFQNPIIDKITAHSEIDLTLPGRQPCVYYCAISAQDSKYEFLSSLFFSCMFSRLSDYARRSGDNGRLPVKVNFLLEEFCNIGKLVDFKKQLALLRGFNMFCQLVVQSVPQLSDRYERDEWEEIISHCDTMIALGVNDLKTANYFSDKCGKITIRVENKQMPLLPLFSPIYSSTRPYSQTSSNTQRALLLPDEIIRMDNTQSLILIRGHKPLMLYKVRPPEFPVFEQLRPTRIVDYVPAWRSRSEPGGQEPEEPQLQEVDISGIDRMATPDDYEPIQTLMTEYEFQKPKEASPSHDAGINPPEASRGNGDWFKADTYTVLHDFDDVPTSKTIPESTTSEARAPSTPAKPVFESLMPHTESTLDDLKAARPGNGK